MGPKSKVPATRELFRQELSELINDRHPLVKLAHNLDWCVFEREWADYFPSSKGRPALPTRLVAGLLYLQHTFACSDEQLVLNWIENPYWQYFCGETYFQHEFPLDRSSLSRWRKRIGEEGVEWMLAVTVGAAQQMGVITRPSLEKVIVDTTVQEKAIAYPTDSRLLNRAREHMVRLAREAGLSLRQNYNREAKYLTVQINRYAHAKQYVRMRKSLRRLKTVVGRVWRDVHRQVEAIPETLKHKAQEVLKASHRILVQKRQDSDKLYAFHAPEVECISKGKTRQRYEFGVKVSIAVTHKEGLVVGARSFPGNPYDGHTLYEALEQVNAITEVRPKEVFVDLGYRGHNAPSFIKVYHHRLKRGITRGLKAAIRRRSAIEPMIGHMKNDGRLRRNWLKGSLGDALHTVLCGCGHNLRMILRKLWLLWLFIFELPFPIFTRAYIQ